MAQPDQDREPKFNVLGDRKPVENVTHIMIMRDMVKFS